MVERGTDPRGGATPGAPSRKVVGLVERSPRGPWSGRDRRFVLRALRDTPVTHLVYAPEGEDVLGPGWRDPFPVEDLDDLADLVELRAAGIGIALAPDDAEPDDPRELAALTAKVDQALDVGVDLVLLRFDRYGAPHRPGDHARLVAGLAAHVGERADLVVVPGALTQTWSTPELEAWAAELPPQVGVVWAGPDRDPEVVATGDVAARTAAVGGRAPVVWDAMDAEQSSPDRLRVGPYEGRDRSAFDAAAGWLLTAPAVARVAPVVLGSFVAWLEGEDPVAAWARDDDDLRTFVQACDGRVPRALVADAVAGLGTPRWWAGLAPLAGWMEEAAGTATPLLGREVAPWRRQVREEAAVCLWAGRVVQAAMPLAELAPDGTGRAHPPLLRALPGGLGFLVTSWLAVARRAPSAMGDRARLAARLAESPEGVPFLRGPVLVEGENATDRLVRAVTALLAAPPATGPLVVEADGRRLEVAADGSFRAPAASTVVVRWGDDLATEVPPGWEPPLPADERTAPPVPDEPSGPDGRDDPDGPGAPDEGR